MQSVIHGTCGTGSTRSTPGNDLDGLRTPENPYSDTSSMCNMDLRRQVWPEVSEMVRHLMLGWLKIRVSRPYLRFLDFFQSFNTGCPKSPSALLFVLFLSFQIRYRGSSDHFSTAQELQIPKLTLLSFLCEKMQLQHKT